MSQSLNVTVSKSVGYGRKVGVKGWSRATDFVSPYPNHSNSARLLVATVITNSFSALPPLHPLPPPPHAYMTGARTIVFVNNVIKCLHPLILWLPHVHMKCHPVPRQLPEPTCKLNKFLLLLAVSCERGEAHPGQLAPVLFLLVLKKFSTLQSHCLSSGWVHRNRRCCYINKLALGGGWNLT